MGFSANRANRVRQQQHYGATRGTHYKQLPVTRSNDKPDRVRDHEPYEGDDSHDRDSGRRQQNGSQ